MSNRPNYRGRVRRDIKRERRQFRTPAGMKLRQAAAGIVPVPPTPADGVRDESEAEAEATAAAETETQMPDAATGMES